MGFRRIVYKIKIVFHLFLCRVRVQELIICRPCLLPPPIRIIRYPHYCNTLARILLHIYDSDIPPNLPFLYICYTPYTIR